MVVDGNGEQEKKASAAKGDGVPYIFIFDALRIIHLLYSAVVDTIRYAFHALIHDNKIGPL